MSVESEILIKEIHEQISETVLLALRSLTGPDVSSRDIMGGDLEYHDVEVLRSINLSQEQKKALEKLFIAVGRSTATGILSIIDGIAMSDKYDLPDLSLINRNTGKDIIDDMLLNEKFIYLIDE